MNNKLLNAILAMDSYNRGYDEGISLDKSQNNDSLGLTIGNYTVLKESDIADQSDGVSAGFYGIAYENTNTQSPDYGDVIVSYRGTDDPLGMDLGGSDIWNGWSTGTGSTEAEQAELAFKFYQEVAGGATSNPYTADISLTGHSLGGGLAGLVSGAYAKEAVVFDSMAFDNALDSTYADSTNYNVTWYRDGFFYESVVTPSTLADMQTDPDITIVSDEIVNTDLRDLVYGTNSIEQTDPSNISGYHLQGEVLDYIQTRPSTQIPLDPSIDFPGVDALALHKMDSLIIRQYADVGDNNAALDTGWEDVAEYFWPVMYDNDFAEDIGMDTISGQMASGGDYSGILRTTLAYSVINEGTLVFGDTGIRALYNDAIEFGDAFATAKASNLAGSQALLWMEQQAENISKAFVEFSGTLAKNKITEAQFSTAEDGVLNYSVSNNVLSVDFSSALWQSAGAISNFSISKASLINSMLSSTGIETAIRASMDLAWADDSNNVFNKVAFNVDEIAEVDLSVFSSGDTVLVSDTDSEKIIGSEADELILAGAGDDSILTGEGDDIIWGGIGINTVDYSWVTSGGITVTFPQPGEAVVTMNATGDVDYLHDIEIIKGTDQSDTFDLTNAGDVVVSGGDGGDTYKGVYSGSSGRRVEIHETPEDTGQDVVEIVGVDPDTHDHDGRKIVPDEDNGGSGPSYDIPDGIEGIDTGDGIPLPPEDFGVPQNDEPDPIDPMVPGQAGFQNAENANAPIPNRDPIILDLDGDGVELTSRQDGSVYFNIAGTEFANLTGWATGGDGILVQDVNSNGVIDDIGELIGGTNPEGGFATLQDDFDTNDDSVLDANDTGFSSLRVWIDSNEDGHTDSGELNTLASLGISSLDLNVTDVDYRLNGNHVTQEGFFTMNGQTHEMKDVWFAFDTVYTSYSQPYDLDLRALFLPEQKGYGDLPDLSIAMSLDEGLLDMVADVATKSYSDLMDSSYDLQGSMRDILLKWAGVDTVTYQDLGSGLDSQMLAFLEAVMGRQYQGNTFGYGQLVEVWNTITGAFSANILAQAGLSDALGNPVYDPSTGTLDGEISVLHFGDTAETGFNDIFVVLAGDGNMNLWSVPNANDTDTIMFDVASTDVHMWVDGYTQYDHLYIEYADNETIEIRGTLTANGLVPSNQLEYMAFTDGVVWDIDQGFNMNDTDDGHTLVGSAQGDVLDGRAGNDTIYAYDGNDTLIGGAGNDGLYGGAGDDTYVFEAGFGADNVYEDRLGADGFDTIRMQGYDAADVRLTVNGDGHAFLYDRSDESNYIYMLGDTVGSTYSSDIGSFIEQIVFDDVTWDLTSGLIIEGSNTSTSESLYGSNYADSINGAGGNDTLYGWSGNDTLIGGAGNDGLYGGAGDDTYVFEAGFGADNIYEDRAGADGFDTIRMQGYDAADVRMTVNNSGHAFLYDRADESNYIYMLGDTVSGTNSSDIGSFIEQIVFDDVTWDLTSGLIIEGSNASTSETLYGSNYADTISGAGGNDTIYAAGGNDTLIGGAGNDGLYGSAGDDTYVFEAGFGADNVYEDRLGADGFDTIRMQGYDAADVRMTVNNSGHAFLYDRADESNYIYMLGDTVSGTNSSDIGSFIEQIVFDDVTWDLTSGLIIEGSDTASSEYLYASEYNDSINGGGGTDRIYAGSGNDTLIGGTGNDHLNGEDGEDELNGGTGNDSLRGGAGDDLYIFNVGDGADSIFEYAGEGSDTIRMHGVLPEDVTVWTQTYYSNKIVNIEYGQNDSITFTVDSDANGAFMMNRIEYIEFDDSTVWDLTQGLQLINDTTYRTLYGTNQNDTIETEGGGYLYGYDGDDTIVSGSSNNTLRGGDGNDTLVAGAGTDTLNGEAGNDTYVWSLGDGSDSISESGGVDQLVLHGVSVEDIRFERYDYYSNSSLKMHIGNDTLMISAQLNSDVQNDPSKEMYRVETILLDDSTIIDLATDISFGGTSGNDSIKGYENQGNSFYGYEGNDSFYGAVGDDIFVGGTGDDTLRGDTGNDTYVWSLGDGNDTIDDYGGVDQLVLHGVNVEDIRFERYDYYSSSRLKLHIDGDVITINNQLNSDVQNDPSKEMYRVESILLDDSTVIDLAADISFGGTSGNDSIKGYENQDNYFYGLGGNDNFYGGDANDIFVGGTGDDTLRGEAGNDTFVWSLGDGRDTIYESSGTDQILLQGVSINDISLSNVSSYNTKITVNSGIDEVTIANQRHSTMDYHVETLAFDDGFQTSLDGYQAWAWGTNSANTMTGGSMDDTFIAKDGDDTVDAGAGDDDVHGGAGADTLYGEAGLDLLHGGLGDDTLYGGDGLDTLFGGAGADTFVFESASAFNDIDVVKDFSTGENDAIDISDLLTAYDPLSDALADFVEMSDDNGNTLLKVDQDGTGGAYSMQQIATLEGVTGLTDEDALVSAGNLVVT